jgi:transcription initiation factor TFIIB
MRPLDGAMVCSKCSVMQPTLDNSAEWRFYGEDGGKENPARCGMPSSDLLPVASLGCIVLGGGRSSLEMRKIRQHTQWQSMPYGEKTLYDAFQHITAMATVAGINKMIIDQACHYHKTISENKTFRGSNRDGIIAASIYIACRKEGCPRTAKEIAQMFNLDATSATKGCKNAMTIINELDQDVRYSVTTAHSFIDRYCSKLGIDAEMTRVANFISLQLEKQNLMNENTPHAVASGIVYFVASEFGLDVDKAQIRKVSDISDVTIVNCYEKICAYRDKILPVAVYERYKKCVPAKANSSL